MNGTCDRCHRSIRRYMPSYGICVTCYVLASRHGTLPEKAPPPAIRKPCQHCGEREATRSRGLCSACYHDESIRQQYHSRQNQRSPEPTMEQIEATIFEQKQTEWWKKFGLPEPLLEPDLS